MSEAHEYPPVMTLAQAAKLCGKAPRTIQEWIARGVWQKGKQYSQPRGAGRFYLRDNIRTWLGLQEPTAESETPIRTNPHSAVNVAMTPGVAAALEREWAAAS